MQEDPPQGSKQQQNGAAYLMTMSNKQNQVIKFMSEQQKICCSKIIILDKERDKDLLHHCLSQLKNIQDYLQRLYSLPSHLQLQQHLKILCQDAEGKVVLKLITRYWEYPTLESVLTREAIRGTEQIRRSGANILHFIEEFIQLIIRAGGIDFFFYTPRNIFLIVSTKPEHVRPFGRLVLNFTSLAGLKLLIKHPKIIREDFLEIYPLLPPNYFQLQQKDVILKKRALGFFLICFIIRKVPQLINAQNLKEPLVTYDTIKKHLNQSLSIFKKLLSIQPFVNLFKAAEIQTGIQILELLNLIFVKPYEQSSDSSLPHWTEIYMRLFEQRKNIPFKQLESQGSHKTKQASKYFEKMLMSLWSRESQKEYYLKREYAIQALRQSPLYLLIKINCNFHSLLKHRDACQLIFNQNFCQDSSQIVLKLIKLFTEEPESQKIEAKPIQKGDDIDVFPIGQKNDEVMAQKRRNLYNPFQLKGRQDIAQIQRQLSPDSAISRTFINKIKSPSNFLRTVSSYDYLDRTSQKTIRIMSQQQTILTKFCCAFWNN